MKIKNILLSMLVVFAAPALADHMQVYGRGQGFDHYGNTQIACNQAYYGADSDLSRSCSNYGGYIVSKGFSACQCYYAPGSPYGVQCTVDASGYCNVQRCYDRDTSVIGTGTGGTTHGDRNAACERAWDRAESDAYSSCSAQRGLIVRSDRGSCSCKLKPGSRDDYTCTTTVRSTCRVSSCR